MAIVISGVNNNDKITASDGTIDLLSGVNFSSEIEAPSFKVGSDIQFGNAGIVTATSFAGNISGTTATFGDFVDVGSNIQLGNAGVATATTFVGNLTGNVNNTGNLLFQIGGSEKVRITSGGRVFIGETSVAGSAKFVVGNGGAENFEFTPGMASNYEGGVLEYIHRGDGNTRPNLNYYVNNTGAHKFWTAGGERLRITSGGRINIGDADQTQNTDQFSVTIAAQNAVDNVARFQSTAAASGTSESLVKIYKGAGYGGVISGYITQGSDHGLKFYTANNGAMSERLRINSSGVVEVKTSGGAATFRIRSGGDQEIYAANDTDKVTLFCDTHQVLSVDGRVSSTNLVSSQVIGYSPNYPAESALEIKNAVSGTPDNDWYWIKQFGNAARLHYCVFKDYNGNDIAGGPWVINWITGVPDTYFSSNGSTAMTQYVNLCKQIGIDKPGRGMENTRTTTEVYGAWLATKRAIWETDPHMFDGANGSSSGGVLIMPIMSINGQGGSSDHRTVYSSGTGTHIPPNQDGDNCNANQMFCGWWGSNDYTSWATNNNSVPGPEDWDPSNGTHTGPIGNKSSSTSFKPSFRDKMLVTCIYK